MGTSFFLPYNILYLSFPFHVFILGANILIRFVFFSPQDNYVKVKCLTSSSCHNKHKRKEDLVVKEKGFSSKKGSVQLDASATSFRKVYINNKSLLQYSDTFIF